jgi:hypothetical protein
MSTKEKIETPGASQVAPSSKAGKVLSSKDQIVRSKAAEPSTKATKSPPTVDGHVPNDETAEVLREAQDGKNLLHYESLEEMFKDLGI